MEDDELRLPNHWFPFPVFWTPEGHKFPNQDKIKRRRETNSISACTKSKGVIVIFKAMNAKKCIWHILWL